MDTKPTFGAGNINSHLKHKFEMMLGASWENWLKALVGGGGTYDFKNDNNHRETFTSSKWYPHMYVYMYIYIYILCTTCHLGVCIPLARHSFSYSESPCSRYVNCKINYFVFVIHNIICRINNILQQSFIYFYTLHIHDVVPNIRWNNELVLVLILGLCSIPNKLCINASREKTNI